MPQPDTAAKRPPFDVIKDVLDLWASNNEADTSAWAGQIVAALVSEGYLHE